MFRRKRKRNHTVNTTFGSDTRIEGKLTSEGSIRIDGELIGEIEVQETLLVGKEGRIRGDIEAANVTVEGQVVGNITAKVNIQLTANSRLKGNITAPSFELEKGAIFNGRSNIVDSHGEKIPEENAEDQTEETAKMKEEQITEAS